MQNYCKTIGALAAASALVAGNAQAEVEYEIHTGYSTEYLFRGLNLGDNLVELGLDSAYKADNFSLKAGVWAGIFSNSPASTGNDEDTEVDWYAEAGYDFGFVTASVGYIYYWNVGALGADTQEVPFTLSHDFGWANIYLTYFWSVDGPNNDGYMELGGSHSWELSPCLALTYKTNLGYLVEEGDFTAWTNKLSLDWGFSENAKLSPFAAVSISLSDSPSTAYDGAENEYLGGSMLSVSF
ncbi:MAG: hypothetical protein V4819_08775 [Verrucomicrobiota bacterium]